MTPVKKKEYIIMDKDTGKVVHEGADRRSVLPNVADFKSQVLIGIVGVVLTALLGFIGYCGDKAYSGILVSIENSDKHSEMAFQKIWSKINNINVNDDNRYNWILQQCCQGARTAPPMITQ